MSGVIPPSFAGSAQTATEFTIKRVSKIKLIFLSLLMASLLVILGLKGCLESQINNHFGIILQFNETQVYDSEV
jgi:hypothetical protein